LDAVEILNRRFREHDLGYEYVAKPSPGTIIRIDSQFVHAEMIEPAIASLYSAGFDGPLDEFMAAHKSYRHGDNKAAMNEALKAFESTMKAICDAKGWQYPDHATAQPLIAALFLNGLLPSDLQSYFGGIRSVLESGVPTARNRRSAHGQGAEVTNVPDHLAAFTLHLTASNIVFLMESYRAS